jgi:hypothetical protein
MIFTKDGDAPPPPPAPVLTTEPAGSFATISNVRSTSTSLPKTWHTAAGAYEHINTAGLKAFYCDAPVTLSFDDSVEFHEVAYSAEYDAHKDWGVVDVVLPGHRGNDMTLSEPGVYLFTYVFYDEDGELDSVSFYFVMGAGDAPPPPPPPPPPPAFSDLGTIRGQRLEFTGSGGRFMPFDPISNSQILVVLSRLAGETFDSSARPWYTPFIEWAEDYGILKEPIDPDKPLTREDMALWFYRYITISGNAPPSKHGTPEYTDIAHLNAEYRAAIAAIYDWGIIRGTTTGIVFGAGNNSERVDIASVIARYVRELEG